MNPILLVIMIGIMTISGAFGALFFKKAVSGHEKLSVLKLIINPKLYVGVLFYLLGAFLNIYLLRFIDYSILYPMTAITYIWTLIVAYFTLGEKINKEKILAISSVLLGVIVLNV